MEIEVGGPIHFDLAGGGGAALVAAGAQGVEADGHFQAAEQIGHEEEAAVHQGHDGDDFACEFGIQARSHGVYAGADLRGGEQDAFEILDDAGDGGWHGAKECVKGQS